MSWNNLTSFPLYNEHFLCVDVFGVLVASAVSIWKPHCLIGQLSSRLYTLYFDHRTSHEQAAIQVSFASGASDTSVSRCKRLTRHSAFGDCTLPVLSHVHKPFCQIYWQWASLALSCVFIVKHSTGRLLFRSRHPNIRRSIAKAGDSLRHCRVHRAFGVHVAPATGSYLRLLPGGVACRCDHRLPPPCLRFDCRSAHKNAWWLTTTGRYPYFWLRCAVLHSFGLVKVTCFLCFYTFFS